MKIFNNKDILSGKPSGDPFAIQEGRIKNGKIAPVYRLGWIEEIFVSGEIGQRTLGRTFNLSKLKFAGVIMVFALAFLVGRSAWLQIVKGEYYYGMAEGNRIRIERAEPKRGIIYDTNKKPLVRNVANFLLYFVPADLPKNDQAKAKIVKRVSDVVGQKYEDVKKNLDTVKVNSLEAFQPLFVADKIPYEKAMLLYLESEKMPGVVLSSRTRREYNTASSSFSHLLGYTGKINNVELKKASDDYLPIDYIGKNGIEQYWEKELRGYSGQKFIEVDALGKEKKIISLTEPQDGRNLVLSIDEDAQVKLEGLLYSALEKLNLKRGSAIVLNPNNGEIIALVSLPAYNNNLFAKGISVDEYKKLLDDPDKPLFSRAVSGEFPSGSTIKPVLAAGALEAGVINENTSFLSNGGIRVGKWFFPDWKAGGHGQSNVRKAIAESVNTFFYIIGGGYQDFVGMGAEGIYKYEKLFGFGSTLGIDLPGEANGFLPTKEWKEKTTGERWYIGNTYNISIGQGDTLVTPLQIAAATSYFAANGKMYRPHLVREILSSNDEPVRKIEEKPTKENIIKDYNTRIVREGMRQTVVAGSARSMNTLPIEAAGKTGTAQWSSKKDPHAWFTGFAPYDNPQIVITVLIEEGKEGSSVSTPVAKDFMQWYFTRGKATTSVEKK